MRSTCNHTDEATKEEINLIETLSVYLLQLPTNFSRNIKAELHLTSDIKLFHADNSQGGEPERTGDNSQADCTDLQVVVF